MRLLTSLFVALLLLAGRGTQAQSTPAAADGQSRLVAGDALRVEVWREKDLSGEFIVDEQGIVTLPLLGRIDVTSIPLAGLRDKLI